MRRRVDIDVYPVNSETLTPQEFIRLVETKPDLIKRTSIQLPQLGGKDFGKISVEYARPIYKALNPFKPVAR